MPKPNFKALFRPPQPAATRRVWCPACGYVGQVSLRAVSMRCPSCTALLRPADLNVTRSLRADLTVSGHVTVQRRKVLSGRLVCGQLTNHGEIHGTLRVGGCAQLHPGSSTTGQLVCQSLHLSAGASLRARAAIGTLSGLPPAPSSRT